MHLLRENYFMFTLCGCWMPDSARSSKCKSLVYNLYSLTLLILVFGLFSMKIVNVARGFKSVQEFAVLMFGVPDFTCSMFKSITLCVKSKQLFDIERKILDSKSKNDGREEVAIQKRCDHVCRFCIL